MAAATESAPIATSNPTVVPYDPEVKHPLKNTWTLWYEYHLSSGSRPSTTSWGDNIKAVYTFGTIEDFWRLYNNVTAPSSLQTGCSYNLFKDGIEPKWEDPSNAKGGKWTLIVNKSKGTLDKLWLYMLLGCIGQVLEEEEDTISGAVVNVRKGQDKLCIWTKDAENKDAVIRVGQRLKKVLELPDQFPCGYSEHFPKDTRSKGKDLYNI